MSACVFRYVSTSLAQLHVCILFCANVAVLVEILFKKQHVTNDVFGIKIALIASMASFAQYLLWSSQSVDA